MFPRVEKIIECLRRLFSLRCDKFSPFTTWRSNNLPTKVTDAEIIVRLGGTVLNKSSVSVDRGFYQSFDNTIVWDKSKKPELADIAPGASGRVGFSFSPHDFSVIMSSAFRNPEISMEVGVRGKRLSNDGVLEEISSIISRKVKLSSDLMLTSRILHFTGPFQNTGPIPPKVGEETVYTITWTVTNTSNNISKAKVTALLPSYVRWVNAVYPGDEKMAGPKTGWIRKEHLNRRQRKASRTRTH